MFHRTNNLLNNAVGKQMTLNKEVLKLGLLIIPIIFVVVVLTEIDFDSTECSWSEHNKYTNISGGTKFFGKCYVPSYTTYTSTKECGLLGISCYPTKPTTKMYHGTVCFKLKTGELC